MPIALIANALLIGKAIRLYSRCHNHYWTATFAEREQLRKTLAALKIESHTHKVAPRDESSYKTTRSSRVSPSRTSSIPP
jgi:hypothetical protein